MLSSQYVQPNNKNIGDIITIYVEHVMGVETDDLTLKTGVNRQKNKLKINKGRIQSYLVN